MERRFAAMDLCLAPLLSRRFAHLRAAEGSASRRPCLERRQSRDPTMRWQSAHERLEAAEGVRLLRLRL